MKWIKQNQFPILVLLWVAAVLFVILLLEKRNDTGPPQGRSGLLLFTDAETGCQYLSRGSGLTPRVNGKGEQMGCK